MNSDYEMNFDEIVEVFYKKMGHYDAEYHTHMILAKEFLDKGEFEQSSQAIREAIKCLSAWAALREILYEILM